jgi:uncharacterized membrane protein YgcG
MEVLDRATLKQVAGAAGATTVQKPTSTTTDASGTQIQTFDLADGIKAVVTCTGVSGQISFGISGRKLVELNAGGEVSYTSCTLTTVSKDGHVIESKKISEADIDHSDVQLADNGDISDSSDGSAGDTSGNSGSTSESGGDGSGGDGSGGDGGGGGGGGDDRDPEEQE